MFPTGTESAGSEGIEVQKTSLLERVGAPVGSGLAVPRLLLVFAHPDDEVLAVGARLERMFASRLMTLTDGAPTDGRDARDHGFQDLAAYREARQSELQAALAGTQFNESFSQSFATPVSDQTAAYRLVELTRAVAAQIASFQPEAVLTHPYEGGHPDHDACAFVVQTAIRLHKGAGAKDAPLVLESPSYHASEEGSMRTGEFLSGSGSEMTLSVDLTETEIEKKQLRLACFKSQAETLAQFGVAREMFRIAPAYNFAEPPHAGQLLYERFGWKITGERFRELTRSALQELFPRGTANAT